jgi:hypothetical protein
MPQCKRLEKAIGRNENSLVLAHIGSRLAASGDWRTSGTCQRLEHPVGGPMWGAQESRALSHTPTRAIPFLLMFSAAHVEFLIKFYPIEKKVSYQRSVAPERFVCCNSHQANRDSGLLSISPVPHALCYLFENTVNALTFAVSFWNEFRVP